METPEGITNPQTLEVAPAEAPKSDSIAEQYEIGDTEPADSVPASIPVETPQRPLPARDEVGRFVSPASARSQHLARMATEIAGLDEAEVASLSDDQLATMLYHLTKQRLANSRETSVTRTLEQALEKPPEASQVGVARESLAASPEAPELTLSEEEWSPEIVRPLKAAFAAQAKRIAALEARIGQLTQREHQRTQETVATRLDRAFAKHKAHLGEGTRADLAPDSAEFQKRMAVLAIAERDAGKGSLEQKIDKAVATLYGAATPAKPKGPKPSNGYPTADEWQEGILAPTTHRRGAAEPKGESKALASVTAQLREMQADTDASGQADLDDFPE